MAVSPEGAVPFMRHYEMMIILDPGLEETTVQPSLEQFLTVVKTGGGSVDKVDVWGRRRLAYEIDKRSEGIYAVIDMQAMPDSVAELAVFLTIALLRNWPAAQANVRAGGLGFPIGRMLAGCTVCLYGLGAIARGLAQRLRPFEVRLVGVTRDPSAAKVAEFGLDACYSTQERDACFAQTDVLILCSRLAPETHGAINADALRALRPGAYLVNAARGGLVDYGALYAALSSGHLAGAGLDVYWKEPIAPDDPLLALPNVIATPHIAGVTDRSYDEIAEAVWINIERLRRGEAPLNGVV